ncbi:adiponectin receptor 1 [Pelobates cultripes]|uniref:Adiponectin receptor 1 n=1 Tax=Pelobates cultripes TaxID=61616 RepID=A0AAD1VN76_PELCU|nr:adiponectin receptor 1 [Pelobates cultripes]
MLPFCFIGLLYQCFETSRLERTLCNVCVPFRNIDSSELSATVWPGSEAVLGNSQRVMVPFRRTRRISLRIVAINDVGRCNPPKEDDSHSGKVSQEEEEEEVRVLTLPLQAHHAMEKMEEFVYKVWEGRWRVIPYDVLPDWLKDNDYLLHGHRPPMPSFKACFRSIFRIHTETGNIWTHLLGFVLFLFLGVLTMLRPNMYFMAPLQEKVVFGMFFLGAVLCLSFSWLFHTVYCHSEKVSRTFSKLDYSGIALLIMGSFVPWLYYSFYCSPQPRLIYLSIVCVLGITAIVVAQWDRFATPKHRPTRAGNFLHLFELAFFPQLFLFYSMGIL